MTDDRLRAAAQGLLRALDAWRDWDGKFPMSPTTYASLADDQKAAIKALRSALAAAPTPNEQASSNDRDGNSVNASAERPVESLGASPSAPAGPALPLPTAERERLAQVIERALKSYRCLYTTDEEGNGMALVDILSHGPTIDEGNTELFELAGEVADEWLLAHGVSLSASPEGREPNKYDLPSALAWLHGVVTNDAQAATFQTLGQYRTWLIQEIARLRTVYTESAEQALASEGRRPEEGT